MCQESEALRKRADDLAERNLELERLLATATAAAKPLPVERWLVHRYACDGFGADKDVRQQRAMTAYVHCCRRSRRRDGRQWVEAARPADGEELVEGSAISRGARVALQSNDEK